MTTLRKPYSLANDNERATWQQALMREHEECARAFLLKYEPPAEDLAKFWENRSSMCSDPSEAFMALATARVLRKVGP